MLKQFLNHIEHHRLFKQTDKILLAVSGGLDSMVMLNLFKQAGFNIAVAHCNFQLRGEDSKADEALVNLTCVEQNIPFHCKRFETEAYAEAKGLSIQMGARELRYNFFQQVIKEYGYNYISTAHHLNDNLETVLLNLVRGTGIDGLTGIAVKKENIIRPMLFATREQISEYASFLRITWREDASNESDYYHRNLLRNQVVPILKKINPALVEGFADTLQRINGSKSFSDLTLKYFRETATKIEEGKPVIDSDKLFNYDYPEVLLWEVVKEYGFSFTQCKEIVLDHQSGKKFLSVTHQLTIDRGKFVITESTETESFSVSIEQSMAEVEAGGRKLKLEFINNEDFKLQRNPVMAQLDADKLTFPLMWRTWKPGDCFQPLGMMQTKKLSDFLIDNKVAVFEKEKVSVIESAGEIVWVVGMRINEKYKVTEGTRKVLLISLS